jgi:hypothetical protein
LNALKTGAAQFGIESGMPGSGLETNQLFGNIAGFSENQQQQGIANYLKLAGTLGPQMTDPGLSAQIAARNADLAAAPDPRLAAQEEFNRWKEAFNLTRSAGTPAGPWFGSAQGMGVPYGATVGRSNWGGSGLTPPDDLGFRDYTPSGFATYPNVPAVGAINPTGGNEDPWAQLGQFSVGPRPGPDWGGFYPGISDEEAAAIRAE